ncbi:conserved Plasmodium protein, unknown function [Plasmodium gallinaceum]|uniref:Uncharacterized protein n=1 Tax=Plasmodium gallinaceum TaxID=5849 RepID=A0A1J1GXB6_PLAGA|nr:conserved Plasmodium protein, unknown function [Plasmodium gallinaceum]CRG97119.1 conserved Plasmodium protein, unknown function [Plasmodium gallinaceum]
MCKELDILNLLKKIKTKTNKISNDIEGFDFDLLEEDSNVFCDMYTIRELICWNNTKEKDLDKYKDVYNNYENEINFYFNEEVEKIIYSSLINKDGEFLIKPKDETIYKSSNIIDQKLNHTMLEYKKLRNYQYNVKYFKPVNLDNKRNFSDSSISSNKDNKNIECNLKDITKIIKQYTIN